MCEITKTWKQKLGGIYNPCRVYRYFYSPTITVVIRRDLLSSGCLWVQRPWCTCPYEQVRVMPAERDFCVLIIGKYSWHESPPEGAKRSFTNPRSCLSLSGPRRHFTLEERPQYHSYLFLLPLSTGLSSRSAVYRVYRPLCVINHLCDIVHTGMLWGAGTESLVW